MNKSNKNKIFIRADKKQNHRMKRQVVEEEVAKGGSLATSDDEELTGQQQTSEQPESSLHSRLGQCEVCAAQPARYACPKCEVKTCCVRCVQIHKKELSCNGIRDRTKYIPLRKMTKTDFLSDYYFLEEATRYVEARKSDKTKSYTRYNKQLPPRLFTLRKAAAERKTTLRFLLLNFTRNRENSSRYDWTKKRIFWHVEWIFVNANNLKHVDQKCDEEQPLHKLLEKYVALKDLEYYASVGVFNLVVLLKAEGIKRCSDRFYRLDQAKTLRENLANKTLVEFPSIYVSYEQELPGMDVIDSDEDVATETENYEKQLDVINKAEKQKFWLKQKNVRNANDALNDNDVDDAKKLEQLLREKRQEERRRKRAEFEQAPSNYLFADEQLLELLSSESEAENGNETEEETEEALKN